jgi:hypothetical protein
VMHLRVKHLGSRHDREKKGQQGDNAVRSHADEYGIFDRSFELKA